MKGRFKILANVFLAGISVCQLNGCATSDYSNIQVEDDDVRPVIASVVWRPEGLAFGTSRPSYGGIEVGYERYAGEALQYLPAGEAISLGFQRIVGPAEVHTETEFEHFHVGYNHLFTLPLDLEVEPMLFVGYGFDRSLAWDVASPGDALESNAESLEFGGGVTPRWCFNRYMALEARLRMSMASKLAVTTMIAPALSLRPHRSVAVDVAYVFLNRRVQSSNKDEYKNYDSSHINSDFRGASLALRLTF